MKTIGILALALVAALVLGFGARSATPTAHADTTGISVVGCELVASALDGDTTNVTAAGEYAEACGIGATPLTTASIVNIDDALGDGDGELTADDLADTDALDGNQISEACTAAGVQCTLLVFVFVDDESPVLIDLPSGLATVENGTLDYTCNTDGAGFGQDEDCSDSTDNNGDGVVVFHVVNATAGAGDTRTVRIEQEATEETADVNIVGEADEVTLIAFKDTVQTSGSSADVSDCVEDSDINDATDLLGEPNITVVQATVVDNDGTELARVSVFDDDTLSNPGTVGSSDNDIAEPADGSPISGTSGQTVVSDAGTAFYQIICGGTDTGEVTITAFIDDGSTDGDNSSVTLNVVGEPANIALTAAPAQIACDGTATSTVTATVTDSEGNNVANGVAVNFSVVALGTANPINTSTTDGTASSTITPLSNASAGVTVIVTSGDAQSSIRVDCSVPIPTQPTAVPSGTPGGTIRPPDTGNGGYLGQDGSAGFPVWALIALAAGTVALVAGGMVTRKAGR